MIKKINVFFILPSLSAGGAERVVSYIAQNINKEKFNSTLIIIGYEKDNVFEVTGINTIYLNQPRVLTSALKIIKNLNRNNPDIVFSAISHLNALMGLISFFFPKIKFIGREVNIPSVLKHFPEAGNRFYPKFINVLGHKMLDVIVCQSEDMYEEIRMLPHIKESKLVTINNPITKRFIPKKRSNLPSTNPKFITVGSLELRKGHVRVLETLKELNFDFEYTIIGNGTQEENLYLTAEKLDLADQIKYISFSDKVDKYLADNDLFLQGSYVEGFPNALLESCAMGTPVIAFEAPGGINEIVINGINGYTATTKSEFKNRIEEAINKKWNPETVSKSVTEKYSEKIILKKYENLFLKCISGY